jgi:hypothetical protein
VLSIEGLCRNSFFAGCAWKGVGPSRWLCSHQQRTPVSLHQHLQQVAAVNLFIHSFSRWQLM